MIIKVIKDEVKHQDIGGKEFIVDEYITKTLTPENVYKSSISRKYCLFKFYYA